MIEFFKIYNYEHKKNGKIILKQKRLKLIHIEFSIPLKTIYKCKGNKKW